MHPLYGFVTFQMRPQIFLRLHLYGIGIIGSRAGLHWFVFPGQVFLRLEEFDKNLSLQFQFYCTTVIVVHDYREVIVLLMHYSFNVCLKLWSTRHRS